MESLDINLLFTNVPFEEGIKICANNLFKNNNIVQIWKKVNWKIFYL